jgi:hypothetical protein
MYNFWSLLKSSLMITHISLESDHFLQYVGEQVIRFKRRKDNNRGHFNQAISQVSGLRLTCSQLTSKVQLPA